MKNSFFDYSVQDSKNQNYDLSQYKGKVVLVVNVASRCGFTPQYEGLESLYKKFHGQNFVILGFPCNQFGAQEPGSNSEIQEFCQLNFGVSFPVLAKIDVNGPQTAPVFEYLKSHAPGLLGTEMIKWNFTKFLIGKDGQVIERFAPQTKPEDLVPLIEKALHS